MSSRAGRQHLLTLLILTMNDGVMRESAVQCAMQSAVSDTMETMGGDDMDKDEFMSTDLTKLQRTLSEASDILRELHELTGRGDPDKLTEVLDYIEMESMRLEGHIMRAHKQFKMQYAPRDIPQEFLSLY